MYKHAWPSRLCCSALALSRHGKCSKRVEKKHAVTHGGGIGEHGMGPHFAVATIGLACRELEAVLVLLDVAHELDVRVPACMHARIAVYTCMR